ncbi:MAG: ADP-ribosylglycohydrolase family protein [Eubacteriales bacterium]|nr:ADP-ribosylglycohydrolase family protein [Eubacteriales bacterium]
MRLTGDMQERIYAGVLGKMIGVYLGRPVEGWTYEAIQSRFGEVTDYIHDELNLPLVVTDDDLSGTFGFFRAVEDGGFSPNLTAKAVGEAWLNYIIEDKTILWWGGLGNSTEHTAYLNLKRGILAPKSGSSMQNGKILSEQIGAQIFMDSFAMMCPGDPERAAQLVRESASVSHDGIALEAAAFLGALEAAAFTQRNFDRLFDENERFISSDLMRKLVGDVRNTCAKATHWREVRDFLDREYGYKQYKGGCNIVPNHALTLAAILLGGDDFARSLMIAVSAGWDTDCNAGNVGCFNGIRLGLDALTSQIDLRAPVRDRLFVVTADGGECVSDAVRETRRIIRAAAEICGETASIPQERFAFEYRGSMQGFEPCPCLRSGSAIRLSNEDGKGLVISMQDACDGSPAYLSTPTFFDPFARWQGYDAIASPSLYEGQMIAARFSCAETDPPIVTPYVCYATPEGGHATVFGEATSLKQGETRVRWTIPPLGGQPVLRVGFSLICGRSNVCRAVLRTLDWTGAPTRYELKGAHMKNITDPAPFVSRSFVSSAKNFGLSLTNTLSVSHPEENGVVTLGTRDFADYVISARITPHLHERGGLVIRARGHRQYYAALLSGGDTLSLVLRDASGDALLAQTALSYAHYEPLTMTLSACGSRLTATVGETTLIAEDVSARYPSGGAGFRMDYGTMMVDDLVIWRI